MYIMQVSFCMEEIWKYVSCNGSNEYANLERAGSWLGDQLRIRGPESENTYSPPPTAVPSVLTTWSWSIHLNELAPAKGSDALHTTKI